MGFGFVRGTDQEDLVIQIKTEQAAIVSMIVDKERGWFREVHGSNLEYLFGCGNFYSSGDSKWRPFASAERIADDLNEWLRESIAAPEGRI